MDGDREKRIQLIQDLEVASQSKIIVYFVGDRPFAEGSIAVFCKYFFPVFANNLSSSTPREFYV